MVKKKSPDTERCWVGSFFLFKQKFKSPRGTT